MCTKNSTSTMTPPHSKILATPLHWGDVQKIMLLLVVGLTGPILRAFSGRGNFYIKIIKHWRAEGARENFGIFDEKETFWQLFCRNLLEFERKYSPEVPIGAAGAKNFQKSTLLKQKNMEIPGPGGGNYPYYPPQKTALFLSTLRDFGL